MFSVSFWSKLKAGGDTQNQRTNTSADFTVHQWDCHWRCSIKKAALKNSTISTGDTCVGVFFFLWGGDPKMRNPKKRPQHRYFPVNTAKILKTAYFKRCLWTATFWLFQWFTVTMGLKVQGLDCMTSGFRVRVTGLVFCF